MGARTGRCQLRHFDLRSDLFVSGSLSETWMPLEVSSAGGPASRGAPSRTAPPRGASGIMSALACIMSAAGTKSAARSRMMTLGSKSSTSLRGEKLAGLCEALDTL